jgi:hypothetical protein
VVGRRVVGAFETRYHYGTQIGLKIEIPVLALQVCKTMPSSICIFLQSLLQQIGYFHVAISGRSWNKKREGRNLIQTTPVLNNPKFINFKRNRKSFSLSFVCQVFKKSVVTFTQNCIGSADKFGVADIKTV